MEILNKNKNKKMRIGIDIDEVLASHMEKLNEFYHKKTGKKYKEKDYHTYNWWEVWNITKDQAIKIDNEFKKSNFFKEILPVEGSIHSLKLLNQNNEVFIITSRPNETKEITLDWFFEHFNLKIPLIHSGDFWGSSKSKSEICQELGINVMIEDNPNYALDCAEKGIRVFLLDKPWNSAYPEHEKIIKVKNWEEVLEKLNLVEN